MILVPIKNTSSAKQRLASVLDQPSRTQLAQAMACAMISLRASTRIFGNCALNHHAPNTEANPPIATVHA